MRHGVLAGVVVVLSCGEPAEPSAPEGAASSTGPGSATVASTQGSADKGDGSVDTTDAGDADSDATTGTGAADGGPSSDATDDDLSTGATDPPALPPANAGLDYQLGGAYPPPPGVAVLSRDRTAPIAAGLYNICYVNGFQTQPNEERWWLREHPDLLLRDENGEPFIDPDWNEILLDITTAEKRTALADIVGGWIVGCGADGFDAVEIDNLDTYARSDGMISQDNAVEFMQLLSATAHDAGMAIAQKNSTEIADRQPEMGTDFAVAEECNRWSECDVYQAVYGDLVFVIEYRQQDFEAGCADFPELSTVLRDLPLVPEGGNGYVYDAC